MSKDQQKNKEAAPGWPQSHRTDKADHRIQHADHLGESACSRAKLDGRLWCIYLAECSRAHPKVVLGRPGRRCRLGLHEPDVRRGGFPDDRFLYGCVELRAVSLVCPEGLIRSPLPLGETPDICDLPSIEASWASICAILASTDKGVEAAKVALSAVRCSSGAAR